MRPRVVVLLVLALILVAAGAFALNEYGSGSRSVQTMAPVDQTTEQGASLPQQTENSSGAGIENRDGAASTTGAIGASSAQPAGQSSELQSSTTAEQPSAGQSPGVEGAGQTPSAEPELRLIAVGDIMLGRGVGMRLQKSGGYEKAFEKVSTVMRQGDVVFANLESPLTASTHSLDSKRKIVLKGRPEAVSALTSAGINLISLANNHMMDYYEQGLFDTMSILQANNILFAGAGKNIEEARKPAILEKNGLKIALLASSDMAELVFAGNPYLKYAAEKEKSGILPRKYETVREDILKLRNQVDLIAVSLHWGVEDSFTVTPEQREFAHKLIDDGADMILGHHPHQFQGIEVYRGKPILYSMGNFLFDQNESENMESFIVDMKYRGTELTALSAIPVRILDKSYVEIQTGEKAAKLLERQVKLCRELGSPPETVDDRLVFVNED